MVEKLLTLSFFLCVSVILVSAAHSARAKFPIGPFDTYPPVCQRSPEDEPPPSSDPVLKPKPEEPAPPGGRWMPSFSSDLGVQFFKEPGPGQFFTILTGTVTNPGKLALLGFKRVKAGMKVTVKPAGNVPWTVKMGGKTFQPCIINVQVEDWTQILAPEKGTLKLKPVGQ